MKPVDMTAKTRMDTENMAYICICIYICTYVYMYISHTLTHILSHLEMVTFNVYVYVSKGL